MESPKEFSHVLLSLDNCIIPEEILRETPSRKDGVSQSLEVDLRIVGCEYIQTAGLLLRLPQVAMATAQVLFQRFFYSKSFVKYSIFPMAMACIFLAAKIEENCRRLRDVINVFHYLRQKRTGRPVVPMEYMGEQYFTTKNSVIKYERFLLKELGFCVHVQHPHKLIVSYLKFLELQEKTQLAQRAWNYMNDSLQTNVFVRFSIQAIACACVFLAARHLEIPLPKRPAWWLLFDVEYRDVKAISFELLALSQRSRQPLEELEKQITTLREQLQKRHVEIKEVSLMKDSATNSRSGSPNVASPLLALPISGQLTAQSRSPLQKGTKVMTGSPLVQQTSTARISPSGTTATSKQSSPVSNGQKRSHSAASSPTGSPSAKRPRLATKQGSLLPQSYRPIHSPIRFSSEDDHSTRSSGSGSASSLQNGTQQPASQGSEDERHSHRRHYKHRSSDKHKHHERSRRQSTSREPERHRHRDHHHHESKRERERYSKLHNSSVPDCERDRDYYSNRVRKSEPYR